MPLSILICVGMTNDILDLVLFPPSSNVVTRKWIFKHKFHVDGFLECYKACILCGFTSRPRMDYDGTFTPVVIPVIVHMVLSLVLSRGWLVHQLDVKNDFLYGMLSETIYCNQITWFVRPSVLSQQISLQT